MTEQEIIDWIKHWMAPRLDILSFFPHVRDDEQPQRWIPGSGRAKYAGEVFFLCDQLCDFQPEELSPEMLTALSKTIQQSSFQQGSLPAPGPNHVAKLRGLGAAVWEKLKLR